ncbi:nonselective cation channel [Cordyceps fumosorosea ARSEF 2679]|uniref:Nonselective cation channel n=1 Tax=Cordyceps fumosorosea (strain ARSEF 2679) TaxID=1081104 RepID=A0A167ZJR3_CORFA|nr:nonselective cation channel [Cordyceps fumosorosea ARSEF 2679]OAA67599.1 nonselective cation channel [Cordyceps fumosorosea ARSEF 2679]
MTQQPTRRRITLPGASPEEEERRPLLSRMYTDHGDDDALYSCATNPHSHLPVYTTIHRIRRDITSVVEDYLSLEQLRDVRINITVVRPLVDKFYELDDLSIVYCLLVNRAQFLDEESYSSNRQNVNWTRATLCEIIATRILRRLGEDHDGRDGLLLLAAERRSWGGHGHRALPALEVAILTESKHFLSSTTAQKVVAAIYEGRVIYTPSTQWDIIPDRYKRRPISLYDPRGSPLLNQYRLIVPRTRAVLEAFQFAVLLALYSALMVVRERDALAATECLFAVYAFGWGLDQFATLIAHGWNVYTQNLWSFLDVGFVLVYAVYLILRLHSFRTGLPGPGEQSFDVLALAAPLLVPRLAFTLLSDNLVFLSLRSMMADFFLLTALSAWCFFGFLLSLLWLGEGAHPWLTISKWMIFIWFGLDGTGIQRSAEFHWLLGPSLMVAFAFLGNTLFLTILVSMLSNTFSTISANATAEIQFRRAVLTLEGVKADAIFAYQPPFNILAVFIFLPLKFVVSPRWFHKIHVATVRLVNLPLLLIIAAAERRISWDHHDYKYNPSSSSSGGGGSGGGETIGHKWFWQKWQLSAGRYLRSVFDEPPPEDVQGDIAVDDPMTHHLIRRQFTRQHTASSGAEIRKPSRRDSTFPGIRKKLRGSFSVAEQEQEGLEDRLRAMEKGMARMEAMLAQLVPDTQVEEREGAGGGNEDEARGESAIDATSEDSYGAVSASDKDEDGDGFAMESSFRR